MMALGDEKTPLLLNGRRHQEQQHGQPEQQHHIISVPSTVVKDSSTEYEAIIFGTTNYSYGLTLEELLMYVDNPKWQLFRRSIFGLFWLTLLLTFLAACSLAYYHNAEGNYCSLLTTNKTMTMTTTVVAMATPTTSI